MSALHLIVTTPLDLVLDVADVASLRAEDESGGFGVLPGHADLLTVLRPSVLRWRREDGVWHYVALRGGVLTVQGEMVRVACREAVTGDDLAGLDKLAQETFAAKEDAARRARGEQMRLHTAAIRTLMQRLGQAPGHDFDAVAEALE